MTADDEQPWLREQLYEINVMLRTLLALAELDSDIGVARLASASRRAQPAGSGEGGSPPPSRWAG